jgi:hypothetical protein
LRRRSLQTQSIFEFYNSDDGRVIGGQLERIAVNNLAANNTLTEQFKGGPDGFLMCLLHICKLRPLGIFPQSVVIANVEILAWHQPPLFFR